MKRYVIIGGGIAGTTAAEQIRSRDSSSGIVTVSKDSYPFYYRPMLADYLCISPKTVEKHRANLMTKLNLHSAAALTALAMEKGLVDR